MDKKNEYIRNEFERLQKGFRNESDLDGKESFGIGFWKGVDVTNTSLREVEEEKKRITRAAFGFYRRNDLNDEELEVEFEKWLSKQIKE